MHGRRWLCWPALLLFQILACVESPAAIPAPVISLDTTRVFQRIVGWEATAQLGEVDCNPEAFRRYHTGVVRRAVNELGLTRLRVELRSGAESRTDTWPLFRGGKLTYAEWRGTWMVATNDNDDPHLADPDGFHWGKLDHSIEQVVLPIRKELEARGDRLYLNLNYIDFYLGAASKSFSHFADPEEYAELIRGAFDHLHAKYGFVPDALEILLEPENTPHSATEIGRAIVAVVARLAEGGYHPDIIAPSTTRAASAPAYFDEMQRVPGMEGLLDELAYHRYSGVSRPTLVAIEQRASRHGIRTAMLEHIGAGFAELYEDLTVANVSAWQQFTIAYCGKRDNPDATGVYFLINQSDSTAPRVSMTSTARLLRQVFLYVRPGAVRFLAESNSAGLRPLAFRNAGGGTVVVGWAATPGPFSVRGLPAGRYGINYSTAHGKYNEELPEAAVAEGAVLQVPMPAAGVVTVYGK